MTLTGILIGIFLIVTFFLPWVHHFRFSTLHDEVAEMRREIKTLQKKLSPPQDDDVLPEPAPLSENTHIYVPVAEINSETRQSSPASEIIQNRLRDEESNFELNIGTKLPVWIGAISLICAAFFLVKYSLESGWLNPLVRVGLGAAFGTSLVAAGQWTVKHAGIANHERIAQGLVGSGIVSLYVSLYAAVSLYDVVPPLVGFIAMAVVTGLAIIMSLRHGQPIAAFGLLGGLLTPALVGSPEPNAMALFT